MSKLLFEANAGAQASGNEWQPADSPAYAAIRAAVEATEKVRGLVAVPETEDEKQARFTAAASHFLGCRVDKKRHERILSKPRLFTGPVAPLPDAFELDATVTAIRNQLTCGSCWDFAAVATVEGAAIAAGLADNTLDLSEQEVLSCGDNGGCNGDWPTTALKFAQEKGLPTESDVPYRATSGSGKCFNGTNRIKTDGYVYIGDGQGEGVPSDDDIKQALITYKCPVACAVVVDNAWSSYGSGIFNGRNNNVNYINHAVNIVGWKTVNGKTVWKVRNHWDKSWGMNGYMWTYSGSNLIGYGATVAWCKSQPKPDPKPDPKPEPPVPPMTPKTFDITLSGQFPGTFGSKTVVIKGVAVERVANQPMLVQFDSGSGVSLPYFDAVPCDGCTAKMPLGWSWEGFKALIGDIYVIAMSDDAQSVENAVLALYGDIREGKYGEAVALALSTWPAVNRLIGEMRDLIAKHRTATNPFNGGLVAPPSSFLDWVSKHQKEIILIAEILSKFLIK